MTVLGCLGMSDDMEWKALRFWGNVDKSGGPDACWVWTRSVYTATGYGQATTIPCLPGSPSTPSTVAHRQAWLLVNGDPGVYVHPRSGREHPYRIRHRCPGGPNRLCCNPTHMEIGTDQDNADDCTADGTRAVGERMGNAKLTGETVALARRLHAEGATVAELARRFGVRYSTMKPALLRKTWAHVP